MMICVSKTTKEVLSVRKIDGTKSRSIGRFGGSVSCKDHHDFALVSQGGETVGFLDIIYPHINQVTICRVAYIDDGYVIPRVVIIYQDEVIY